MARKLKKSLKIIPIILLLIIGSYFLLPKNSAEAGWWNDSWHYRKSLIIDHAQVAGDLENFPVLVSFTDANVGSHAQSDGHDIIFVDSEGKKLSHEIESFGSGTGVLVAWVKIPSLSSSDDGEIFMYYGNATADNQQDAENVWDSNFKMVQHLDQDPSGTAPQMIDSTTNNNDGTSGGTMLTEDQVAGKMDGSLDFDGVDDYVDVGTEDILQEDNPLTISGWIYPYTIGENGQGRIVFRENVDYTYYGISFHLTATNALAFQVNGSTTLDRATANDSITLNQWQYVTVTWDGSTTASNSHIYINGTEPSYQATTNGSALTDTVGGNTYMGNRVNGNRTFDGVIDDVRVSNIERSTNWIQTEYNNQNDPASFFASVGSEEVGGGPVGYWSFDEGFGATAHDESSGGNDGTITGAVWKDESECVSGKCLWFDGTDDYVRVGSKINPTNTSFSVSLWYKIQSLDTEGGQNRELFHQLAGAGVDRQWIANDTSNGILRSYLGNGFRSSAYEPVENDWTHVELVYDISAHTLKWYIDGILTNTNTSVVAESADGDFVIGVNGTLTTGNFHGLMDEVKIYPYARTADQIKQDYNAGLAGQSTDKGAAAAFGGKSDSWLSDGLVGYWKMDEASWNGTAGEVIDASGNGNNGTAVDNATTAAGKFGKGGTFDGTGDGADIGDDASFHLANNFTLSGWINPTALTSSQRLIHRNGAYSLLINSSNSRLWYWDNVGGGTNTYSNDNVLTAGSWQYVVVTKSSTDGVTFYVNGDSVGNTNNSNTRDNTSTLPNDVFLGIDEDGSSYPFAGSMDEVRIYNRALSAAEVKDLYEYAPGTVMHLKMDEKVSGDAQTLYDTSGNGNNGTTVDGANNTGMDCTARGKYGSACQFDGVDDYMQLSDTVNYLDFSHGSISLWYKSNGAISGYPRLFDKGFGGSGDVVALYFDSITSLTLVHSGDYGGNDTISITVPNLSTDREWHNVVASWDVYNASETLSIALDGIKYIDTDVLTDPASFNGTATMGSSYTGGSNFFNGIIDDVHIYNYARTQKQILEDMNGSEGGRSGKGVNSPILDLDFDEGFGASAHNKGIGGASLNGTLTPGAGGTNTTATQMWSLDGKNGKAMEFDGTDDYVDLGDVDEVDSAEELSGCAWVYHNGLAWDQYVFDGMGTDGIRLFMNAEGDGGRTDLYRIIVRELAGSSEAYIDTDSNSAQQNTWNHICFTYKENTSDGLRIYINGEEDAYSPVDTTGVDDIDSGATSFKLGTDGASKMNGMMDDVKIYNYVLTEDDIKTVYNSGVSAVMGSSGTDSATGDASNAASGEYCIPGDTSTCDAPVLHLKMDEKVSGDAKTLYDISGNGNNGTTVDGANNTGMDCTVRGKYGSACEFDGVDDEVTVSSNPLNSGDDASIEFWIKSFVCNNVYALNGGNYFVYFGSNKIRFYAGAGSWSDYVSSNICDNDWHYIAVIHDNSLTNTKIYVDGSQEVNSTTGALTVVDDFLEVAARDGGNNFSGIIDDVRIYNYTRTPAQIAWDYNKGRSVAEWRMDEASGSTAHNSIANSLHATLYNMEDVDWVSGKFNNALDFDGSDEYADIGDTNLNINSIGFWINADADTDSIIDLDGGTHTISVSAGTISAGGFSSPTIYVDGAQSSTITAGAWHHIFVKTDTAFEASNMDIGRIGAGYFGGLLDEVKIFNYALTLSQVKNEYNNGAVRFSE